MIILLTGQPGNGKTLRAMALMVEEYNRNQEAVKAGKEEPRRFFSNVAGSYLGDTLTPNPHAFPWVEAMPEHNDWTKLPPGSYVLLDEAHADGKTPGLERYGVLFPSTGKPGESDDMRIRAMSTHRHGGYDLVLMTQWPTKLHHQLRTLVGKHIHMNRAMGLQRAGVLTWTRTQVDPYDERQREKAEEEIWPYPQDLYPRYVSATLHTATYKFRVPRKVWQALSMVLMMVVVGWGLWVLMFKPDGRLEGESDQPQAEAPLGARAAASLGGGDVVERPATIEEYAELHQPRFPDRPWTAPIYDDRKPTVDPLLVCMATAAGEGGDGQWRHASCTCLTEQGTAYAMDVRECTLIARRGPAYNPYRERRNDHQGAQLAQDGPPAPAVVQAVGIGAPGQPARYGQFRNEPQGPETYTASDW